MEEVTEEDFLQWFAGFFDADGSIYYTSNGTLQINISQSEKTVLEKINSYYNNIFGEACKKNNSIRTQFQIHKSGKALYPVLIDLGKYSVIKNPQIQLALEFLKYINLRDKESRLKRIELGEKIKTYNNDHKIIDCIKNRPYETNMSIPYLAGLLDGDGCVSISNNFSRYVKITQRNDPLILSKIKDLYPGSRYKQGDDGVVFERKQLLIHFLNDILPFLIYKKNQVLNFLEFLDTDDVDEKIKLRDKVKFAKKFDLDPVKYSQIIKELFIDLDENYTTEDLMLSKKLKELQETRVTKSYDEQIFNNFDKIDIKPKLIFCETRQQNVLWTYYRKKTSSITFSGQMGRNIRILIFDETSKKYIGLLALGSDFYNITARDNEIKKSYPDIQISDYINLIANITCCVPLQPFGYNCNGGKLLLKLAFSKEVYDYWYSKYKQPLLLITTLGVNGKSVMYSRLKEVKLVGYTTGSRSSIHIPDEILDKCKTLYKHLGLETSRTGTMAMLNTLFDKTKINVLFNKHITKKSVYFGWVFETKLDKHSPSSKKLKTVCQISSEWKERWCSRRLENVRKNKTFKYDIELMTPEDVKFKSIKNYTLPRTMFLSTYKRKIEQEQPKLERQDKIFILERMNEVQIKYLISLKGKLTTEDASKNIKEKYNIIIPRNEISMLFGGQILPSKEVLKSTEYKSAMDIIKKRVYTNEKSEAWKNSIKPENRKATINDYTLFKIMLCKKEKNSAEECSKNFNYTGGKKTGQALNRTAIQNVWTGKTLPKEITKEYQELLDYKRTRKTT